MEGQVNQVSDLPEPEAVAAQIVAHEKNFEIIDACKGLLKGEVEPQYFLNLLFGGHRSLIESNNTITEEELRNGNTELRRWAFSVGEAVKHLVKEDVFSDAAKRPSSLWRQGVKNGEEELRAATPNLGQSVPGQELTGQRAVMRARALLSLGATIQIPLWNSGLWVILKAPTEQALLELDRRIAEEKVLLGRITNGMVFSNTSVYISSYLVNFVLAHVADVSYRDITPDKLKTLIRISDIPQMVWGMLCTIYPKGYPLAQPCMSDPAKCTHVVQETINLTKLSWTDNRSISEYQAKMMSRRNAKFSDEELERYQTEHVRGTARKVDITESLRVVIKVPTIAQYEQSGFDWVDGIVNMVESSFAISLRGQERESYIIEQSKVTVLRQYSHWVSSIEMGAVEQAEYVNDRETIELLMANFSGDEALTDKILEEIGRYIEDSTISMIAIPKYNCPQCNAPIGESNHEFLVPLEVSRVFFTLVSQRLTKILLKR